MAWKITSRIAVSALALAAAAFAGAAVAQNMNIAIATGETPLMTCASSGNSAAVRLLLTRGASVNAIEPSSHQTAVM